MNKFNLQSEHGEVDFLKASAWNALHPSEDNKQHQISVELQNLGGCASYDGCLPPKIRNVVSGA